jgi:hypothetical protein
VIISKKQQLKRNPQSNLQWGDLEGLVLNVFLARRELVPVHRAPTCSDKGAGGARLSNQQHCKHNSPAAIPI